jgi:hypothetical protein
MDRRGSIVSSRVRSALVLAGLLTLVAAAAFRLSADVSEAAVSSTMHASVGPGFEISLTFDDGTPVLALPAGSYRVVVGDAAVDHNFHLTGPGVNELTSVEDRASVTWNVLLREGGLYTYLCDPHADTMYGRFNVGANAAPPSDSPGGGGGGPTITGGGGVKAGSKAPAKATGKIVATVQAGVDAAGKLKLTLKGKRVTSLAAGSYKLVIADASKRNDVVLRRVGAAPTPLTGLAFTGARTITTQLGAGQWRLYSSPRAASAIVFRVTKA